MFNCSQTKFVAIILVLLVFLQFKEFELYWGAVLFYDSKSSIDFLKVFYDSKRSIGFLSVFTTRRVVVFSRSFFFTGSTICSGGVLT